MTKNIKTKIKNFLWVVIGTTILAFGVAVFLIPSKLVTGGLSGIAIILNELFKIPVGSLPFTSIDIYVFVLTWALFFLGLFILGKDFALKTLLSSIVYPFALALCQKLVSPKVFDGFFIVTTNAVGTDYVAIILSSIFGGAFVGAGCALTYIGGGSTGGLDILAFTVCKMFKKLKSSTMIFVFDALVVIGGMFVIKNFIISLLGITSAFVCAIVIDKLFLGESRAFIANIVSEKYDEINNLIIHEMDRTSTIIEAAGGFTKEPRKLIMVSFTMREYAKLTEIVRSIDKEAFMTIQRAHEINGTGWTIPKEGKRKNENNNN